METRVSCRDREVSIRPDGPTVLIGERINPTGKKRLAEALRAGDWDVIRHEALAQVEAGADILDVNVVASDVDERALLPRAIEVICRVVDVPLCIDVNEPEALKEALKVYEGKPIVNSVTGEEKSLNDVLPLVKEYGAAVIGLTLDDQGIPKDPEKRFEVACRIVERAESGGIPREDVIIDCLALSLGADDQAAMTTLGAIRKVRDVLGVNQTLGASNISFGMPDRPLINQVFLSLAVAAGVTCPTVDAARVKGAILATDLVLGRDRFSQRFTRYYRSLKNP
jgi:5-methyltetrahydrofolate--homocysteine methyltransferase